MSAPYGKVRVTAISLGYRLAVAQYDGGPERLVPLVEGFDDDGNSVDLDDPGLVSVIGGSDELGWFREELIDYDTRRTGRNSLH